MKITILGTGSFYANKERSGASYLLEADGKKILIDCGPGTLIRLSEIGIKPGDLDYIFISHFHADHTSDLFPLQMNLRLNEFFGTEPLKKTPVIYGPAGIKTFTKRLSHVYQLYAFENWAEIKYVNYSKVIKLGKLVIKPYKVKHTAFNVSAHAYALRFELENKVFTFSGDSVVNDGVEQASKGADLFLCDASYAKGKGSPAHMATNEIGEIAEKSKVKKVVLTHFYPNTQKVNLVAEVEEKYSGEVIRGADLMELDL